MNIGYESKLRVPAFVDYHRTKLYIAQVIFLFGIFMKQFYLFPSGTFQVGDFLMITGCILYVAIVKKGKIVFINQNWWFLAFLCCVLLINSIYYVLLKDNDFINSTLYYAFNFVIIVVFSSFMMEDNKNTFLWTLAVFLKLSLLIQGALYLLGLGNWQSGMRYIGTFHDPNQFGVFIFFSMLMIYLCDHVTQNHFWFIWSGIATLVVLPSASTGTLLGLLTFWTGMYISNFRQLTKLWKIAYGIVLGIAILMFLVFGLGVVELPSWITSHFMYKRIEWKLALLRQSGNLDNLIGDRVWNRVVEYPIYFLYGSGEGGHLRFDANNYELHSSILGPAFAYGFIPFIILVVWVFKTIGHSRYLFIYVAMFVEALFVVNTRQPMYWMLMVMSMVTLRPRYEELAAERSQARASAVFVLGNFGKSEETEPLRG